MMVHTSPPQYAAGCSMDERSSSASFLSTNLRNVCLFVGRSCSPLSGDQPWQVRYWSKVHDLEKVQIVFMKPYNQQVPAYMPIYIYEPQKPLHFTLCALCTDIHYQNKHTVHTTNWLFYLIRIAANISLL